MRKCLRFFPVLVIVEHMPLLNYTTKISAAKTIGQIQGMLAEAGAAAVLTEYAVGGIVEAISFRIEYQGQLISFRLPARLDPVYKILNNDPKVPAKLRTKDQAARVAWRIVKDWVEAQVAIVEAEQVEMVEVFLPFAQNPVTGITLFKQLSDDGFKLLTHGG